MAFVWRKALFFAHEFHPGARTVQELYVDPNMSGRGYGARGAGAGGSVPPIPESLMWSYICQIICALHKIHSADMACRAINPRRILIVSEATP